MTVNEAFCYPWFDVICRGASALVNSAEDERTAFQMLVNFGRRRGRSFLGHFNSPINRPFFGLCNPHILRALVLRPGIESGICYLRSLAAAEIGVEAHYIVIVYSQTFSTCAAVVIATAGPHTRFSANKEGSEAGKQEAIHARWVIASTDLIGLEDKEKWTRELSAPSSEYVSFITKKDAALSLTDGPEGSMIWDHPPKLYHPNMAGVPCASSQHGSSACQ